MARGGGGSGGGDSGFAMLSMFGLSGLVFKFEESCGSHQMTNVDVVLSMYL